ncbi:MAG: carboxypeptidase regulatory-like domain-containing protein [Candidatus Thermoplasmatota archaeon]|nr:carboxypeptidase regulatory-like domain-containing protein [Candidatus Thermoplasmatota archaeon]
MAIAPRINKLIDAAESMGTELKTGIVLVLAFILSLFLSTYFILGVAVKGNFAVSGGSDAYYNMRIIQYILSTHHQLMFDPGLNYPIGLMNPRPPFFHWFAVLLGYAFSPFLGGVYNSTMTMFLMSTAIGGAFIVFPTYFLGKELFNRRVGLIAAVLVVFSPLTLMKSISTIGLFDIFTALFGLMFIYYYLRAVNTFNYTRGEKNSLGDTFSAIKKNQLSIIYALLAGTSLAASMLTWDGSISLVLILVGAALIQVLIYAIRRKSALSIFVSTLFFGSGFLIAFPWYYVAGFIPVRFDYPLIVWIALLGSTLYFLLLEKKSWVLSIGSFAVIGIIIVIGLDKFNPGIIQSIISGQHYFIKNKVYTTIAEAQALPLGEDILEFGPLQFFASVIGTGFLIYFWLKKKDFNMTLALLYFAGIIFISMIASKFLYFGATAISILTGMILVKSFDLLKLRETIEKSRGRPLKHVLRKEFKFSHYVVVLIVVFLLVVPTTFYAVDSGIPFNNKTQYDREIYNATPAILRPQNYTPPYYLGAFGVALDLPNSPWVRALDWFKTQDTSLPPSQRPAFVSWWDYGFQTLEQGDHPVMADNFQDGIYPAAQILMAQNESQIVSVMITRLLDYYYINGHLSNRTINGILQQFLGKQSLSTIDNFEMNGTSLLSTIYANPSIYGQREGIQPNDAKYILMEGFLSHNYSLETLNSLYSAIEAKSGFNMSYIAVDYRLFPFSGTNTGIFYAPAYLGDFPYVDVSGEIVPTTFFNISVTDVNGNTYLLQNFPSGDTAVNYSINYQPAFYNSTIYRMFIGYSPSVVGATSGIPGVTSNLQYYYPMQAWGEPNFELAYKTVFWNPYTDYQNHSTAWQPVSLEQGYYYQVHHDGTVDLNPPASQVLPNDVVFVHYYPGAIISGRVTDTSGQPVQGVRVTITDQYGIPHQTVLTNATGYYSIYAVAGNDTVTLSSGSYNPLFMVGSTTLNTFNITISTAQADRTSYTPMGVPTWNITHNFQISSYSLTGSTFLNVANTTFYLPTGDIAMTGKVMLHNVTYDYSYETNTSQNGTYLIQNIKPGTYEVSAYVYGQWYNNIKNISITSSSLSKDIAIPFGKLNITVSNGVQSSSNNTITIGRYNFTRTFGFTGSEKTIYLPTGTYYLNARNGQYSDNVTITIQNKTNSTIGIHYTKYYSVSLRTSINGQPVSAAIGYANLLNSAQSGTVFSGDNGVGSLLLNGSVYSIYVTTVFNGMHYAYFETLNLSSDSSQTIELQPATLVTGITEVNGVAENLVPVQIIGSNGYLQILSNSTGFFSAYIPSAEYRIYSYSTVNSQLYVSSSLYSIGGLENNISLQLGQGYYKTGNVTYGGSGVSGIAVAYVQNQPYAEYPITSGKAYRIAVADGISISTIGFTTPGYAISNIYNGNITLKQLPVGIEINASYNGNKQITLKLTGPKQYEINGTHSFVANVIPGTYKISFLSGNISVSSSVSQLQVQPVFSDQVTTLNLTLKAQLTINSPGSVYIFSNGNLVSTSQVSSLQLGNYTIYASYGNGAALVTTSIQGNTSLYVNLQQGYLVTLNTNQNSEVMIESGNALISWYNSLMLPSGYYKFTLSSPYNNSYDYYASYSTYISSSTTVTLNATLREMVSAVRINAFLNGSIIQGAAYSIQGPTNASGYSSGAGVTLKYGSYAIYVSYGQYAYFGGEYINSSSTDVNVSLSRAYPLSYSTFMNNTSYSGTIVLKGRANFVIPSSGVIYLPNGSYNFTGTSTGYYYGFLSNYNFLKEINITGLSSATFTLGIDQVIRVSVFAMAGSPIIEANENFSFPVSIISYSNVPLTFTIGNNSIYPITGQTVTVLPHNSAELNVYITVPSGQPSGTYNASYKVYYGGSFDTFYFNFTVPSHLEVVATANSTAGQINNNSLYLPLKLSNTGNTNTNVTVRVLNSADLASKGINVTINKQGNFTTSLVAGHINNTFIVVTAKSPQLIVGTPIYLSVDFGNKSQILTVVPSIPSLSITSASARGVNLQNFSTTAQNYYIYGFSAFIVIALAIAMVMFRRRARA